MQIQSLLFPSQDKIIALAASPSSFKRHEASPSITVDGKQFFSDRFYRNDPTDLDLPTAALRSMSNVSGLYGSQGRYDEANPCKISTLKNR